jgi:hypothetical protein
MPAMSNEVRQDNDHMLSRHGKVALTNSLSMYYVQARIYMIQMF